PRQRYGVAYVFCLGRAQMSQQKDSALVLYRYLLELLWKTQSLSDSIF
ncbi:MAG: hypothetical protein ACI92C_002276, partial [Neolewinella sp.]